MKDYSQSKVWGKVSAGILAITLILASMDMVLNADREIYNITPILGIFSACYLILDGINYIIIKKHVGYNIGRLIAAIVFIVIGLTIFVVSDVKWLDYTVILAIYYLTLGYARDRIESEQLHYRLALLLGVIVLAGCIIGVLLWIDFITNILTFSLLIVIGIIIAFCACCIEIRQFKFKILTSVEYWCVTAFVIVYCCVALLPQIIY